jgi:hypothetical protein
MFVKKYDIQLWHLGFYFEKVIIIFVSNKPSELIDAIFASFYLENPSKYKFKIIN